MLPEVDNRTNRKDHLRSPAHLLLCLGLAATWGHQRCRSWAPKGAFLMWLRRIDAHSLFYSFLLFWILTRRSVSRGEGCNYTRTLAELDKGFRTNTTPQPGLNLGCGPYLPREIFFW